ncbi:MAG: exodeoxyribonuclease V subunit gamma, partial [Myxococcales bacterium]|nr:exodeoxyribonuclease V subunit gamma [Myxococcales bacterium]
MLHLTYSNRMEVLAAPLAERVGAAQRADPLTPVLIVVPNRAVEQFVRFRLAERLGVAANLKFSLMRRFLADLVTGADPRVRVLDKEALHLLLFGRLRDEGLLDEPGLEAVRAYLGRAGDPVERDLRALQLGGELARLFEEYSFSRRAMLRRWRREVTLAGTDLARAESWQRRLFLALFDERQCARIDPVAPPAPLAPGFGQLSLFEAPSPRSRWMMLIDAVFALRERLPLPPVVHLFGISYVAPAFAEVFALLAERTELCIYGLNPCLEFWEDVTTVGLRALREGDARRGEKLADEVSQSADPFGLDRPGDTPALRLWGRPGREFIRLLNEMCECRFASGFIDPLGQAPPTLLRRLQRDVLLRAPETAAAGPETPGPDDSIRILACPGIRREVEIVADEIWALIRRDEQAGDRADPLRFHEIAVMVTDADREAYLTHIESIFRERHDLPFNIIDRSLAGQSRVVEAIDRLLDLPLSDFNFEQVMAVLTHPAIGGARADELDRWRAWCAQLNIVFGADRRDLEGTYIDEDVFHWDQAARRLALGAFMTGERSGDVRVYETATGVWLPFETAPDAVADVGRLIALLRGLIADARACEAAEMSLTDWAIYLTRLVTTYVRTDAVADEIALSQCLGALERLRSADLEGQIVRFAVARDLARLGLRGLEGWRGQHQADGVVVSSLLPMRAIPFKAVFVLGLGEGQFPAAARNDPLDLRQA